MKRLGKSILVVAVALLTMFGLNVPAQAATAFWTIEVHRITCGRNGTNGFYMSGHYLLSGNLVRADGYSVTLTSGNGGITQIGVYESQNGTNYGTRVLNFTNNQSHSDLTGIQTTYEPWLDHASHHVVETVTVRTTLGMTCSTSWTVPEII